MSYDSDPEISGKAVAWVAGIIVVVIGFFFFLLGFHSVNPGEIGIVKTGGSLSNTVGAGWTHIWWPFQSMDFIDVKVQKVNFDKIDASSQEQQSEAITGTITYHINQSNALKLYQTINLDNIEPSLLQPALTDYIKEATVLYPAADVLNHRADIRQHALTALNAKLAQNYPGIVVDDIFLSNIGFSDAYNKAIEDKQVAQQQVSTAQQNQDKAKIDAQTALIEAQGQANANGVLQQSLGAGVLQQHAIDKWDGHFPTTLGGGSSPFSILVTPTQ